MFRTEFSGYSVEFSPFEEDKLAVATAQHFGIVGNGRQYVLGVDNRLGQLRPIAAFDSRDGLFDCAWSEENETIILSGSGDGSLKLWDIYSRDGRPLAIFQEHSKEIYTVDWNMTSKDMFLSGSWDRSIKLWSARERRSLFTFSEHSREIYSTIWSPRIPTRFASVAADKFLKIWDINERYSVQTIHAHRHDILSCDWNKYHDTVLVTASSDKTLKVWDLRNPSAALEVLHGHRLAVRRVKFSPHFDTVIASCGYDMSAIVWDLARKDDPRVRTFEHHTEFVVGLDFSIFIEGQMATCSWDDTVVLVDIMGPPIAPAVGGIPPMRASPMHPGPPLPPPPPPHAPR